MTEEAIIIDSTKRIHYNSYRCPVCAKTVCWHNNLYVEEFPKPRKRKWRNNFKDNNE